MSLAAEQLLCILLLLFLRVVKARGFVICCDLALCVRYIRSLQRFAFSLQKFRSILYLLKTFYNWTSNSVHKVSFYLSIQYSTLLVSSSSTSLRLLCLIMRLSIFICLFSALVANALSVACKQATDVKDSGDKTNPYQANFRVSKLNFMAPGYRKPFAQNLKTEFDTKEASNCKMYGDVTVTDPDEILITLRAATREEVMHCGNRFVALFWIANANGEAVTCSAWVKGPFDRRSASVRRAAQLSESPFWDVVGVKHLAEECGILKDE